MTIYDTDTPATAIAGAFVSPNETDSNGEAANVVDGLFAIARAINRLADVVEIADNNRHLDPDSVNHLGRAGQ